ncbi:hypothetical protein [Acidimangrovimonas pyrenivorans]|uniref:Cation transport ATPase n=1 Tax=Acidimangrovimonas pyrenivorans TaxID=2030798 RepID=A0ABV7ACQ1_9RHOB
MSTWISNTIRFATIRGAAGLALAALLSACAGIGGFVPHRMAVAEGSVIIAGPPGYCVDEKGSRDARRGAFVLLGSCASLSGSPYAPRPKVMAVLTAAVSGGRGGASIAGSEDRLAAYFTSSDGRAALSRSGRAATVKVLDHHAGDGAFFLHLRDSSAFPGRPDKPESWRVLFDLNGRIVTLTVVGLPDKPIIPAQAEALLRDFMARVRHASPKRPPPPEVTEG